MFRKTTLRALLLFLQFPPLAWADANWSQMKAGMTRTQTVAVLGRELVASKGRGFEVAIYDGAAEVVFLNDQVVAWTAPATATEAPASPRDAMKFEQVSKARRGADAAPAAEVRAVYPRPAAVLPAYRL